MTRVRSVARKRSTCSKEEGRATRERGSEWDDLKRRRLIEREIQGVGDLKWEYLFKKGKKKGRGKSELEEREMQAEGEIEERGEIFIRKKFKKKNV